MITWQGFTAGIIAAIIVYALLRAALWALYSRPLADAMEGEHGDVPRLP
jgi:hypothetical protein